MILRSCLLSVVLALTATGCSGGGSEKAAAPAAKAPAKAAAKPAAATAKADTKAAAPAAADAGKGTITGAVAFTGTAPAAKKLDRGSDPVCAKTEANDESVVVNANKTLKNVIVRVTGITAEAKPPAEDASISQENCLYKPRVQGVIAGQKIAIKNADQTLHNIHTYRGSSTVFNQAQPQGTPEIKKKLKKGDPDVIKFKCDVHPWMTAYVLVSTHPHFAITGDDGAFKLEGVPAGKYTVEAWHETYGTKKVEVEVAKDGTAKADFSFDGTEKG